MPEPSLTEIHFAVTQNTQILKKMDKILTGGDEPEEGLVYKHQGLSARVKAVETDEKRREAADARRNVAILGALVAAIGTVIKAIWDSVTKG